MKTTRALGAIFAISVLACSSSSSPAGTADGGAKDGASAGDGSSGGSSSSSGGPDGATGADAGADAGNGCGLVFYASDYEPSCQLILDKYCCDQEKACGGNATCAAFVACVNACTPPRQADCVTACGSGGASLDSISQCTKTPPYNVPTGLDCTWPQ